jgi:dUTP pyrophosphatase
MISSTILNTLQDNFRKNYAILKLAVDPNKPELQDLYKNHVENHNHSLLTDPFPNAGFDLFVPETTDVPSINPTMISMHVKCEMLNSDNVSCGYYMFPRSSISKTPLMLANHTGIIDSGYRGNLIGAFRNLFSQPYTVEKQTRLLQICHPSLSPVYVVLVKDTDLSTTSRGEGGFGSSGI